MSEEGLAPELEKAFKLSPKLELEEIGLAHLEGRLAGHVENPRLGFTLERPDVLWVADDKLVRGLFNLELTIDHVSEEATKTEEVEDDDGQRTPLAVIRVGMRVIYRFLPKYVQNEDAPFLPHFLGIQGFLHVWPYIRAEVQNLSNRLSFPPLILPLGRASSFADVRVREVTGVDAGGDPDSD